MSAPGHFLQIKQPRLMSARASSGGVGAPQDGCCLRRSASLDIRLRQRLVAAGVSFREYSRADIPSSTTSADGAEPVRISTTLTSPLSGAIPPAPKREGNTFFAYRASLPFARHSATAQSEYSNTRRGDLHPSARWSGADLPPEPAAWTLAQHVEEATPSRPCWAKNSRFGGHKAHLGASLRTGGGFDPRRFWGSSRELAPLAGSALEGR